ncbi:2-keto-4-pentenoate hydratase [Sphingomonas sp. 37zxx]|uniref:2-keto-4-pentenoate hydratase n=1 Tax=Sphingomonas sp. 37zxx TaxID=1550073 RepID=UPI000689CAFA|nr:2-keto-4-pentenoate hydratase [Sphingomonas sp. 37zxx]
MASHNPIARAFVEARRAARALPEYPGDKPTTLAAAYAIQDQAIGYDGRAVIGWKVGRINAPVDALLGTNRLAGPIFADQLTLQSGGHTPATLPIIADGFAAAEAEYCVRIGKTPTPGKLAWTLDEVIDLIDAVHIGIEIASSPYPGINTDGPLVTISDFGNNYGLLIGDAVPDWRSLAFLDWAVVSRIGGEIVGEATARTMLDGPIGAVAFLIESLAARGMTLQPGQWVSSGAVTGVHPVVPGDAFTADFGELRTGCTIDAATVREMMQLETGHGREQD